MNESEWQDDAKYSFKVVVLGDKGVGKSSLLKRFQFGEFDPIPSWTIGVGFSTHRLKLGSNIVHLDLWDTAGEERFKSLTSQYYRNAHAAIIVFDLTSKKSFNNVKDYWIRAFHRVVGSSAYIVVVGNKSDLIENKEADQDVQDILEAFQDLAEQYCIHPWKTSAKEATNVETVFKWMTEKLIEQVDQLQSLKSDPESFELHTVPDSSQQGLYTYCCGNG